MNKRAAVRQLFLYKKERVVAKRKNYKRKRSGGRNKHKKEHCILVHIDEKYYEQLKILAPQECLWYKKYRSTNVFLKSPETNVYFDKRLDSFSDKEETI